MENVVGIDYGSKLAGTTVIAYYGNSMVRFKGSKHQEDADRFILDHLQLLKPEHVFLDAPLSLPGRYYDQHNYSDYFYREADKALGAMSPMFIGGLTARAIKLKDHLESLGMRVFETYPSHQSEVLGLPKDMYKRNEKHIFQLSQLVADNMKVEVCHDQVVSWHHFDALLAYVSGLRYLRNNHLTIGDEREGLIVV